MAIVTVPIFVESRYKVNRKRIRKHVSNLLNKQEVVGEVEVSIAVVGDRKMRDLSRKYKGEDKTRSILSFSLTEGETSYSLPNVLSLGEIVLSYPEVIEEAAREEMLVDEKIDELIEHGLMHLLGINHE
ncbi:MAG: rRNA maturation RNase YbeY [Patescibacteria group bacterium]|nr:rRNA maturation RNase YbeY [Patescibacteria group bacterium]